MNPYTDAPYFVIAADGNFHRPCLSEESAVSLAGDMHLGNDGRREFSVVTVDGDTVAMFEAVRF